MKNHDAEDADAAEFAARGAMPMVSPGDWATAGEPASWGGRGMREQHVKCVERTFPGKI